MQVIRLSRIGKQNQAAFRLVLSEKTDAVKGANQEILGFYNTAEGKKIQFDKDRIEYWISKGAKPSDSVASLLKLNGVSGMEKFMEPRNKKKISKSAPDAKAAADAAVAAKPAAAAEAAHEAVAEAPAAETQAASGDAVAA